MLAPLPASARGGAIARRPAGAARYGPGNTGTGATTISQTYEFYSQRAEEADAEAQRATLDNVRERALRAKATWLGLAEQARRVARERARVLNAKEAERVADT